MRTHPSPSPALIVAWLVLMLIAVSPTPPPRTAAAQADTPVFRFVQDGVSIDAGSLGTFTLRDPAPGPDARRTLALVDKDVSGNTTRLHYAGGGTIELRLGADGEITLSVASMPRDVKSIRVGMLIDFGFSQGGSWRFGSAAPTAFPASKPANPYLFQGRDRRFTFENGSGRWMTVEFPPGFTQLQDNRAWGWKIFDWWFAIPHDPGVGTYRMTFTLGGVETPRITVDSFGQSTLGDFPGKLRSAAELESDVVEERRWLDSLAPNPTDAFGGRPGSGAQLGLRATGFFHVEQKAGRWWLVDPTGNAFFQLGVCSMAPSDDYTYVTGRERAYAWLPSPRGEFRTAYRPGDTTAISFHLTNWIRKTGRAFDLEDYLSAMIARVRTWGFNSAGAFSPTSEPAVRAAHWPYVAHLPLLPWDGIPEIPGVAATWDPFDDHNRQRVEQQFAARVAPHADDSLLIGYFLANEPLYENLPRVLPGLKGTYACKRRLVQSLQDEYETIGAFDRAWSAQAKSFDELIDRGLAVTTRAAERDVRRFVGAFLDEYYRFVRDTFRRYDRNHLLLGSRFQRRSLDDEQLCRICGTYMDVVSFNYYTLGIDRELLDRFHAASGNKPMLLSEFYYSSPSDSRLPGGAMDVDSQQQRGLAYRNYVEQAAASKYVVGIEWFTLVDQSLTGRYFQKYAGENANTGLISVADRPWKAMLGPMMETNAHIYDVLLGRRPPFAWDDPRFRTGASRK